jgi:L-asparaginase / beta-aspartyl-peptidase
MRTALLLFAAAGAACVSPLNTSHADSSPPPAYALVIHGGAGYPSRDMSPEQYAGLTSGMQGALSAGLASLEGGASALDVVELVIQILESDSNFNSGVGAVCTANGGHELDASIMDGETLACGAVGGVTTVEHPIALARLVMEETRHVLFVADGAEAFADSLGDRVSRVPNSFFDTERTKASLKALLERRTDESASKTADDSDPNEIKGTVGCVVLDSYGHLAAGTSTGGLTGKSFGRIGDSPIIGAGTYADDETCAISCTGVGEEYIRYAVARDISARMEYLGMGVAEACDVVIHEVLKPGDGGVIGIDRQGNVAMSFNTTGMVRAVGNSQGRFDVGIWEGFEDL